MATRVGRSEIQMTQFDCPTPENSLFDAKI